MSAVLQFIKDEIQMGDFRALIPVENFSLKLIQGLLHLQFKSHLLDFSREKMPRGFFKLKPCPVVLYKLNIKHVGKGILLEWVSEKPENWWLIESHILQLVQKYHLVGKN